MRTIMNKIKSIVTTATAYLLALVVWVIYLIGIIVLTVGTVVQMAGLVLLFRGQTAKRVWKGYTGVMHNIVQRRRK